ncbi:MAG: hypothetical protein ACLQI7_19855 [Streptosporangiaceae bacterium]|jgi:hypothetical protein
MWRPLSGWLRAVTVARCAVMTEETYMINVDACVYDPRNTALPPHTG